MDLRFAICNLRLEDEAKAPAITRPCRDLCDTPDAHAAVTPFNRKSQIANRKSPKGFSFTEILFAVMILGIGFIMVAAMFPVAIRQTEATNQETIAASIGRSGTEYLRQIAAMQWPPVPASGVSQSSLLVPTFASYPVPASVTFSAGQTSAVVAGDVWSMYDTVHDTISFTYAVPPPAPALPTVTHKPLLWSAVENNLIQPGDARFGWVAMYRRDLIYQGPPGGPATSYSLAPYAQVIVIAVQSRNKQVYDGSPITATHLTNDIPNPPTAAAPTPFVPQYVSGAIMTPPTAAGAVSTIQINSGAVAENTYVIICHDYHSGVYNGRVYRIGVSRPDLGPNTWALAPGEDMAVTDPTLSPVDVFVVGRGADPNNPGQFIGPAQDVSVYSTYVPTN